MHKYSNKWFTLVELIIVVIIVTILATIAFFSLTSYSEDARDAVRLSDLSKVKTSLWIFFVENWKYSIPENWVDITYSWTTVWNQWIFWEQNRVNVRDLSKVPLDPLTNSYYTYSVTQNRLEYQIWTIIEGNQVTYDNNFIFSKANAWTSLTKAYIAWTYNNLLSKTVTWSTCNVLTAPTIIANDTEISRDLWVILANDWLVYSWKKNLPNSYKLSKFRYDWWFNFHPNKFVAYSWSCDDLTNPDDDLSRVDMLKNVQESYSWTVVAWDPSYKKIIDLNIDVMNPSNEVLDIALKAVVPSTKRILSWSVPEKIPSCATQPNYSNAIFSVWSPLQEANPWQNQDASWPCYYECTGGYTWTTCSNLIVFSCATQPSYTHANFVTWTPTQENVAWQNTNSWAPCYYQCIGWYTWNTCNTMTLYSSCKAILDAWASTWNGDYTIQRWDLNWWLATTVYCDMTWWWYTWPYNTQESKWNTVFLLQSNSKSNWSTVFTETVSWNTPYKIRWTPYHSTAHAKFWSSSIYFNLSQLNYMSSNYNFWWWDRTIDAWVYSTWLPTYWWFVETCTIWTYWITMTANGSTLYWGIGSNAMWTYQSVSWWAIPLNQWNHLAVVRKWPKLYVFINWVLKAQRSVSLSANTNIIWIWWRYYDYGSYLTTNTWMDQIRVSKYAIRTSNFTPPTLPSTFQ